MPKLRDRIIARYTTAFFAIPILIAPYISESSDFVCWSISYDNIYLNLSSNGIFFILIISSYTTFYFISHSLHMVYTRSMSNATLLTYFFRVSEADIDFPSSLFAFSLSMFTYRFSISSRSKYWREIFNEK
jgi:hypothetical protein